MDEGDNRGRKGYYVGWYIIVIICSVAIGTGYELFLNRNAT